MDKNMDNEHLPSVHNTEFTTQHIQNEVSYFTLVSLLKKKTQR